jgi:hypothetical protein
MPNAKEYTGPRHYNDAQRAAYADARKRFPDAYRVPGLGWCGPKWGDMLDAEREIDALASLPANYSR